MLQLEKKNLKVRKITKKTDNKYETKNKRVLVVSIYILKKSIKTLELYIICMVSLTLGHNNKKYLKNKKKFYFILL